MRFSLVRLLNFSILNLFFFNLNAHAESLLCKFTPKSSKNYDLFCRNKSSNSVRVAGSQSSVAASFNLNPAALPTEPSGYGIEAMAHGLRPGYKTVENTFGLLKGFKRFGTGLTVGRQNTFYSNAILQRLQGNSENGLEKFEVGTPGPYPNFSFGTALKILDPEWGPAVSLGLKTSYRKANNSWSRGAGLMFSTSILSFGGGLMQEKISDDYGWLNFQSFTASLKISALELEYIRLMAFEALDLSPIHIYSAALHVGSWTAIAAQRNLYYRLEGFVRQYHYSLNYRFGKRVSLGLLHNFIPGTSSIGIQTILF